MDSDALLNAYIDLNLLLLTGAGIWLALKAGLKPLGLGAAFLPQLRLLNGMVLVLALSPVVALCISHWVTPRPPNFSDMLVSQFLQGNLQMRATEFEALLGARDTGVQALMTLQSGWAQALVALFLIGAVICALQTLWAMFRLRQVVAAAYLWKRHGKVHLMLSDQAKVAFSTRGVINRYVILPSALLQSPKDLQMTIAHELQHFRQRDIEFEIQLELLRPLLWWNPAFHIWRREVRHLRELACDQALIARPHFDVRAYCECLIRACALAAQDHVVFSRRSPTVALVDRRETRRNSALHRRILAAIDGTDPTGRRLSWLLVTASLVLAVFSAAVMIQRPGGWSHDRIMLSTIVNLERMAARNADPISPFQGGFVSAAN